MNTYYTEQRRALVKILEGEPDRQFSARELTEICVVENPDMKINESTVYRTLSRLVESGKAERSASPDGRFLVYRYTGKCSCAEHIHIKCTRCGQVCHLEDEEAEKSIFEMVKKCHFNIDEKRPTIVGVCDKCAL